jgi:methyltransferase (TIGR00027 family)
MRAGRASRTAEQNALFRALESALPHHLRLFDDRLASVFLTPPYAVVARLATVPGLRQLILRFIDHNWPGVRTSLVARTRLIDDMIASSLQKPVEQFVILGAGFDTRAYRLPCLRGVTVFEVDHPDTQIAKRRMLERAVSPLPESVRFVATDFKERELGVAMRALGYRESARTFILWEGVTNYLTEPAVDATLRWVARALPGTRVLFTYVHRDIITRPNMFFGWEQLFAALERAGERFTFGIDPAELSEFLARRGLLLESDIGAAEYRQRYFKDAANTMRGHEFYRVALAMVGSDDRISGGPSASVE